MARFVLTFVVVLAVAAQVLAKERAIPSFIEVCHRSDPHVEDCILKSVEHLRPKLKTGIPEMGVPPMEPLVIKELVVNLGGQSTGFSAVGHDVQIHGASDFHINRLSVNLEDNIFSVSVDIPRLTFNAIYDVNIKLAILPLKGHGPMNANATDIKGDIQLFGKRVTRDGGQYYSFDKSQVALKIGDFHVKLENLFDGNAVLTEVTNTAINANRHEFLQSILPILERTVGDVIMDMSNKITKNFTYDQLFPK